MTLGICSWSGRTSGKGNGGKVLGDWPFIRMYHEVLTLILSFSLSLYGSCLVCHKEEQNLSELKERLLTQSWALSLCMVHC